MDLELIPTAIFCTDVPVTPMSVVNEIVTISFAIIKIH